MRTQSSFLLFPNRPSAAILFCAIAFLPSILHLACPDFPVTNPFAALGPVVAGFSFVAGFRELRVNLVSFGTLAGILLWYVNWFISADGGCCATLG